MIASRRGRDYRAVVALVEVRADNEVLEDLQYGCFIQPLHGGSFQRFLCAKHQVLARVKTGAGDGRRKTPRWVQSNHAVEGAHRPLLKSAAGLG